MKLLRVKEMESARLRKNVGSLQSNERSLGMEYEDAARVKRREEEGRLKGELGSTASEEEERRAIGELKRVENRVKVLQKAHSDVEELKDFKTIMEEIRRTQEEIRVAEAGIRGLVGKKGVVRGVEEVREELRGATNRR